MADEEVAIRAIQPDIVPHPGRLGEFVQIFAEGTAGVTWSEAVFRVLFYADKPIADEHGINNHRTEVGALTMPVAAFEQLYEFLTRVRNELGRKGPQSE
ncbi:MAG TPA: hypothetical protein VHG92_08425 [Afifellaceae bacterium]|nr:hypothetical protein [Afifellaceae bacterium]